MLLRPHEELLDSIIDLRVPRITLIIRNAFGGAYAAYNSHFVGADMVFAMPQARIAVMGPGGGMPLHTNQVEHEQYVLTGRARVTVEGEEHEVAAGHVLYIPAGARHAYSVLEAPFEFLCIVPNAPDRIDIVDPSC